MALITILRCSATSLWSDSFEFTLLFTIISMLFHVVLGVLLAVMLNVHYKGQRFLRTITLIPWAMPVVVAAQAGRFMFNDQFGLINDLIRRVVRAFRTTG